MFSVYKKGTVFQSSFLIQDNKDDQLDMGDNGEQMR